MSVYVWGRYVWAVLTATPVVAALVATLVATVDMPSPVEEGITTPPVFPAVGTVDAVPP